MSEAAMKISFLSRAWTGFCGLSLLDLRVPDARPPP